MSKVATIVVGASFDVPTIVLVFATSEPFLRIQIFSHLAFADPELCPIAENVKQYVPT
jgi:hypothetical protein